MSCLSLTDFDILSLIDFDEPGEFTSQQIPDLGQQLLLFMLFLMTASTIFQSHAAW